MVLVVSIFLVVAIVLVDDVVKRVRMRVAMRVI